VPLTWGGKIPLLPLKPRQMRASDGSGISIFQFLFSIPQGSCPDGTEKQGEFLLDGIDRMIGIKLKSCKSCYPVRKASPKVAKFNDYPFNGSIGVKLEEVLQGCL